MKKQILFLSFFVLAIFAGLTDAYGQTTLAPGVTDPTGTAQAIPALNCLTNSLPLHPYAGVSYTYTMDGSTGAQGTDMWTWFATKDPDFITNGVLNTANMIPIANLLANSANYGVATAGANSVDITWTPDILSHTDYQGDPTADPSPTFVVGYATGENCTDNIQVYEINPKFNFTIDIASINPATDATLAWDAATEQCVDVVRGASYNAGTIEMNYGANVLVYEVAAANFVNDFTPTFRVLGGLVDDQTAKISVHATYADAKDTTVTGIATSPIYALADVAADGTGTAWNTNEQFNAASAADVVNGVSLYVRVIVYNHTYESLANNDFILAVDAQDNNQTGIWDMEDDDCTTATDAADWVDTATHTVTPRPTIIMDGAAMGEGDGNVPDDVDPKN